MARRGAWVALLCTSACAAPATPAPAAPVSGPETARLDADFGVVEATGQGVLLPLPDVGAWRREPREARTWVVRHTASQSHLLVRTFRSEGIARGEDCEQQMRSWRPDLPALAPEHRAETRRVHLGGEYSGELITGAERDLVSAAVTGHALLFASDGRECLCLAFSTSAEGAEAASTVGARLGSIARGTFERARRIGIEEAGKRLPRR